MSSKQFPQDFQKVQKNKQLWKSIEFKLQLSLGISSVIINNIWNIENTHLIAQFSSESKGGIVLQSFIPKQKLTEKNRLTKICEKGYDIADEGMIVNVGFNIEKSLKQKKQSSCIMNKISVGKSYCYDMNKYQQSAINCPEGFQSIYLYNDEEEQTVKYNHQYILFRSTQIIPCYYIEYNIIGSKQQQKIPSCENCNRPEPAKFYCVTEEAYFCIDCDKQYHDSKIAAKHNRVDVGDKPKKFGVCSLHSGRVLELYCAICCQALCFDCKVFGDHNQKNMSDHKLSRLDKAYSEIASKVKEIDPNIERRKNQLTQDLSKIDLKIKEINQKATHIEEQLQAIYCKVLTELKSQTQTKLSYLIGDQLQLKRQYDHIQWIQGFIKFASQTQQSQQFLKSWNRYSKYKKQILGLQNLSINTQVKADMKLVGHLSIEVESKKKHPIHDMSSYQKIPENIMTPVKQYDNIDKQLGSTSLRKTIFKKHYVDKSKQMGSEPRMAKGGTTMNKVPLESDV